MGIRIITSEPPKVEQFSFEHILDYGYIDTQRAEMERHILEALVQENNIPPEAHRTRRDYKPYGFQYKWTWAVTTFAERE